MKTRFFTIMSILLILLSTCSKELEEVYSTELKFPEFVNIEVVNAAAVAIEYGEEQQIIVTGNELAIKDVVTEVISETLIIDKQFEDSEALSYKIITPYVREVKNNSVTDIYISDFEQEEYLSLVVANIGNITLGEFKNVNLLNISIENEGSVFGFDSFETLNDLNIKISGTGEYKAFAIEAKNVIAEIDGNGSCSVYAEEELHAIINGNGSVYYKGNPAITISGEGYGAVVDAN